MKKRKALSLVGLLALTGCSQIPRQFAESTNSFAVEVGGEYLTYVGNDTSLTEMQRQIRTDRVNAQIALTEEALNDGSE